jgi:hypothetical protein
MEAPAAGASFFVPFTTCPFQHDRRGLCNLTRQQKRAKREEDTFH